MEVLEFKVGDECWIHGAGDRKTNPLTKATVVHVFTLDGWAVEPHYVVEVPTEVEPVLHVRNGLTMSDKPDKPIGFYRNWPKC